MASDSLEPVYLIVGDDAPKVGHALRRLRARFDAGSIEQLFAAEVGAADAVAATEALGLFGGGERLVVVDGVERWKKPDVEAIARYAADPTPGAVLALTGDPAKLPAGLDKACGGADRVLRYDVPKRRRGHRDIADFASWIGQRLGAAGVTTERGVAERLIELAGEDAYALETEVAKIASWAGEETVRVSDVERLVAPSVEASIFAVGDAWGSRDTGAALAACEAQLAHDEVFLVTLRLADHAVKVRAVQEFLDQGLAVKAIAERLGVKEYPARKQAGHSANFTRDELGNSIVRLATVDWAIKGGSRLQPALELERALVEVTGRPDRSP
jgi:DNA polymerase-3 subunit delta